MRYRNVSGDHRIWPTLTNAETGRTLELADGEDAEIDGDVTDDRLEPVRLRARKTETKTAPEPTANPDPAKEN